MKVDEILTEAYTAYIVDQFSRQDLERMFPPKYPRWYGHHITVRFGVPPDTPKPPDPVKVFVYGYADDGHSIEAFAVEIDGQRKRPDGKLYHITWSLDPSKRKPKDSNELLQTTKIRPVKPIEIGIHPAVLA